MGNRARRIATWVLLLGLAPAGGPARAADAPRRFEVTASRYAFAPARIEVTKGETIELVLRSADTDHGFAIKAYGVKVAIPKGGATVERLLRRQTAGALPVRVLGVLRLGAQANEGGARGGRRRDNEGRTRLRGAPRRGSPAPDDPSAGRGGRPSPQPRRGPGRSARAPARRLRRGPRPRPRRAGLHRDRHADEPAAAAAQARLPADPPLRAAARRGRLLEPAVGLLRLRRRGADRPRPAFRAVPRHAARHLPHQRPHDPAASRSRSCCARGDSPGRALARGVGRGPQQLRPERLAAGAPSPSTSSRPSLAARRLEEAREPRSGLRRAVLGGAHARRRFGARDRGRHPRPRSREPGCVSRA